MDEANALHDKIMRGHLREFFGFEVCTEGDAFQLAFHDPADAVKWCITVQQALLNVPWDEHVLALPGCQAAVDSERRLLFSGPRVRMGG
eukprot:jgi/Astpho2/5123/e_gw1.00073.49.1_t